MKFTSTSAMRMVAAAALGLCATVLHAQDKPVEMKFAHWLPGAHPLAKTGFEPWAKSVEAASHQSRVFPCTTIGQSC